MFALTPLAAALQGIGYGPLQTALQGLIAVTIIPEPLPIRQTSRPIPTPRRRSGRRRVILPPPAVEYIDPEDEEEALAIALAM